MYFLPTRCIISVVAEFEETRIICSISCRFSASNFILPTAIFSKAPSNTAIFGRLAAYIMVSGLTEATRGRSGSVRSTRATARRLRRASSSSPSSASARSTWASNSGSDQPQSGARSSKGAIASSAIISRMTGSSIIAQGSSGGRITISPLPGSSAREAPGATRKHASSNQ